MKLRETWKSPKDEDADSGCVRAEVLHKQKDVTREHECKNMTEHRSNRYYVVMHNNTNKNTNKNKTELRTLQCTYIKKILSAAYDIKLSTVPG